MTDCAQRQRSRPALLQLRAAQGARQAADRHRRVQRLPRGDRRRDHERLGQGRRTAQRHRDPSGGPLEPRRAGQAGQGQRGAREPRRRRRLKREHARASRSAARRSSPARTACSTWRAPATACRCRCWSALIALAALALTGRARRAARPHPCARRACRSCPRSRPRVLRSHAPRVAEVILGGALAGVAFGAAGGSELGRTTTVEVLAGARVRRRRRRWRSSGAAPAAVRRDHRAAVRRARGLHRAVGDLGGGARAVLRRGGAHARLPGRLRRGSRRRAAGAARDRRGHHRHRARRNGRGAVRAGGARLARLARRDRDLQPDRAALPVLERGRHDRRAGDPGPAVARRRAARRRASSAACSPTRRWAPRSSPCC